jgi:predicted phage terminase large subunit-like protein
LWEWFTQVAMTRLMAGARVVVIMTRWHEDDIVGRLTDPKNPCYNDENAQQWRILSLPAIAVENDPMERKPGEALWPERYGLDFLNEIRRLNPKGFSALYQGQPTPDDGDFFRRDWLKPYPHELPKNLRYYCVSDHAVSTAQTADKTVLLPFGLDEEDNVWILPDVWWRRASTDQVIDGMIDLMSRHKPAKWGAERGHISQSIGPFLRKVQQERGIWTVVEEITPVKDKQTRAQAIRGRMAMDGLYIAADAPFRADLIAECLRFPAGVNDDQVDALGLVGQLLDRMVSGTRTDPDKPANVDTGYSHRHGNEAGGTELIL